MRLPKFSISRPVTTIVAIIVIFVLGFVSLGKTNIDLLPDVDVPIAVILTTYPGASSEEVESLVTKPIEKTIASVENIKTIASTSEPNVSMIEVKYNWGTDLNVATMDLREKLDIIKRTIPDDADEPVVLKLDPSMMPVLIMGMLGDREDTLLKQIAEDVVVKRIENLEGVASVRVIGGVERQIRVQLIPEKMDGYGVAITQVIQSLALENMNIPAGNVDYGGRELIVRTTGEFDSVDEIQNLVIANRMGSIIRLKDIAVVDDATEDRTQYARIDNKQGLRVLIQKQSDANTVRVAESVKKELNKLEKELPKGIEMYEILDQSDYINRAIDSVKSNAINGAILAFIVIYLFLHNFKSTLVIALSIPISIITTFVFMYFAGISLNLMSLGGLAVGVGMLVDNAIVVFENIYRHQELGKDSFEAADIGASEVGLSVIASTLTTVAVFLPIVFIEGLTRTLFKELSITIAISLASSLLVALTVVPLLCSRFLTTTEKREYKSPVITNIIGKIDGFYDRLADVYSNAIKWSLGHRKRVVFITIAAFIISIALFPVVGSEFFPETDEGKITVDLKLDMGTKVEKTNEIMQQIEAIVLDIPEVEMFSSQVGTTTVKSFLGTGSGEIASMDIRLVPLRERKRSTKDVVDEIREKIVDIPGSDINVQSASIVSRIGAVTGSDKPVQVCIKGEEFDVLEDLANVVKGIVVKVPGTTDVDTSISEGRPEVQIKLNRDRASLYGMDAAKIAMTIRSAIHGNIATQYKVAETEVDINIQLEESSRTTLEDIKNMSIMTPTGVSVPLDSLVTFNVTEGYDAIKREDQERIVYVTADTQKRSLGSIVNDIDKETSKLPLPEGYSIKFEGQNKIMKETFEELTLAGILAVILVYAVMAAQFESFLHPFTIMFALPLAAIGVVGGLLITRKPFCVPAFMGAIMLAGIVVNNAIVLVDYINQLKASGKSTKEAIIEAGPTRLRAILMTTLTTVLGLVPLALGIGEGAEVLSPMAVTVIGGLLISTLLTLIVVPVLYSIFDDVTIMIADKISGRKSLSE